MSKNKRNFSSVLSWLLVFILAIPVIGGVLYFTVPKVKEFTDEKILKIEQSVDDTETDSDNDSAEVIAGLQQEISANQTIIANLNTELENQRVEVTKLQNEAKASEELVNTLQASINEKQSELDSVVAEKQALETQKEEILAEIEAKQAELEQLQADAEANAETIETLEKEKSQYQQLYNNALDNIHNKDAQIIELDAEINVLEEERDSALADLAVKQAELDEANATITAKENEVVELENRIKLLEQIIAEKDSTMDIADIFNLVQSLKDEGKNAEFVYLKVSDYEFLIFNPTSVSGFQGVYLYNTYDNSLECIEETGYYFCNYYSHVDGSVFLSTYDGVEPGVYLYDTTTRTFSLIIEDGIKFTYKMLSNNSVLLSNANNYCNIYHFDHETRAVTKIADSLYSNQYVSEFENFYELNNGYAIFSNNLSSGTIRLYNPNTKQVTDILSESSPLRYAYNIDDNRIYFNTNFNHYIYDLSTKSLKILLENSEYYYGVVLNEKYILFSYTKSVGSALYNLETGDTVDTSDVLYNCNKVSYLENGNVILYGGASVCLFDAETETITKLYSRSISNAIVIENEYYVEIYDSSQKIYYYIYGSDSIVTTKPVFVDFVVIAKDVEGNIIEDVGGSIAINPQVLTSSGTTATAEILSEANIGYYLSGIYSDEACLNLIISTIDGETTINYSDVSSLINTETNTITLYALYEEVYA